MHLEGTVTRIVFTNPENDFVVIRVEPNHRPELIVAKGIIPGLNEGEQVFLVGEWRDDPRHGPFFHIEQARRVQPTSKEAIEKYLSSGLIKGIGKAMAERLVEAFGEETLDVIEESPERLREVEGIGRQRSEDIQTAWRETSAQREVMVFLHDCRLGTALAARLMRHYGAEAPTILRTDPYRVALDIRGVGFRTADTIGKRIGVAHDALERLQAGVMHLLNEASGDGHTYLPEPELRYQASEFLDLPPDLFDAAFDQLIEKKLLCRWREPEEEADRMAVAALLRAEAGIAFELDRLQKNDERLREFDVEKAVEWSQEKQGIELAERQQEAVRTALRSKVMVLTGGPGTGKTTIVKCILSVLKALKAKVGLAAPTGRAARRLAESSRHTALTLHRLLKIDPGRGFIFNARNQLKLHACIVDEASMIDTGLMYALLRALPDHAKLILVGDADQLPSVGPGSVLDDIRHSGTVPVVSLTEIYRQAKQSLIIRNAHRINAGEFPIAPDPEKEDGKRKSDFFLIKQDDPTKVREQIVTMVTQRIPEAFGIEADGIQVLTPMNRGTVGTEQLNTLLQGVLNPSGTVITQGVPGFRLGDRVMQIRNNYDKDVSNGDIGKITGFDPARKVVQVTFSGAGSGHVVDYTMSDLRELVLSYAISIHKSQGSEFPAVVLPLVTQHFIMLQRNLLYTGVTRARKLAVLVGSSKAIHMALQEGRNAERRTSLRERLERRDWDEFIDTTRVVQQEVDFEE